MQAKLESLNEPLPDVYATYYGEDWKTQGDWLGRAFRDWAVMCAAVSPFDHRIYFSTVFYDIHEFIGPNRSEDDVIRRWVHWLKTDNPKVLWDPFNGYRRQSEWDDHGEAYPISLDGPDLWYLLEIRHEGMFKLGMYILNKDGVDGHNRLRDYTIEIYPTDRAWVSFDDVTQFAQDAENQVSKTPPLVKNRVRDFWGGVHKQFIVKGPSSYYVKIDRNYSYNTILSSVSIDRLSGEPTMYEKFGIPFMQNLPYGPPELSDSYSTDIGHETARLWYMLDNAFDRSGNIELQRKSRVAAYQTASVNSGKHAELEAIYHSLKWRLNQWDAVQRKEWKTFVQSAWQIFYDTNPTLRESIDSQKNGPPIFIKENVQGR